MRKTVVLFLILIFIVSGCGAKSTDVSLDTDNPTGANEMNSTEEKPVEEETSDDEEFEIGTVENDTYENHYLGIKCELSEWTFLSREELVAETELASVITSELIDGENYLESFENAKNFSDMKAIHPNGITNMNIVVSNISEEEEILSNISEETMLYLISTEIEKYFDEMGLENVENDIIEIDINGTTKHALYYTGETNGVSVHMMQLIHSKDKHRATLTITGLSKEECFSVCDSIYFEKS